MKYIVGLALSILYFLFIRKIIPEADILSQVGFLIYTPVLFILYMTFSASQKKMKEHNSQKTVPNNTTCEIPSSVDSKDNDLIIPMYIHNLCEKELPASIFNLSPFDKERYLTLIEDLNHFSINTKDELRRLLLEYRETVLTAHKEKFESVLLETKKKLEHYISQDSSINSSFYQDRYEKHFKNKALISTIGFFNLALKQKFQEAAITYFQNKKK